MACDVNNVTDTITIMLMNCKETTLPDQHPSDLPGHRQIVIISMFVTHCGSMQPKRDEIAEMTLDDATASFLAEAAKADQPPLHEMSVDQAREMNAGLTPLFGDGP